MPGDERAPHGVGRRSVAVGVGCVPVLVAVVVGAAVERVTGVPTVVAGLVALTAALVASPRLLAVVQPAADLLLRLLPALFVPLVAGVAGVGGDVRSAWPAALAAIVVSVPAGFLVTARLAGGARRRDDP
jgi:putative effector of murein hydrolase LrgA (UPF0299 family)